jgi:2'-hydroxyisoflavone reductase
MRDRTKHYTFISTLSVYDNPAANDQTDEDSPVLAYTGSADPYSIVDNGEHYGALKALCETEAEKQFPGRALVLRPGFIAGPDETHGVLTFWAARGEMGGELLAAGKPSTPVQYIDVRDMAEWVVRLAERRLTGKYNAVSPVHDLDRVIGAAVSAASTPPKVTWVPSEWLAKQSGPGNWGTLRFWEMNEGHITRMSNARAVAGGLTYRPVRTTLADTLAWYRQQPAETRAVLNAGFERDPRTGRFAQALVPWADYLAREREVLAAWHAEQSA